MFGSGFSLGFTATDIGTQVTGLLGNAAVVALIATGLALSFAPRIVSAVKRMVRR